MTTQRCNAPTKTGGKCKNSQNCHIHRKKELEKIEKRPTVKSPKKKVSPLKGSKKVELRTTKRDSLKAGTTKLDRLKAGTTKLDRLKAGTKTSQDSSSLVDERLEASTTDLHILQWLKEWYNEKVPYHFIEGRKYTKEVRKHKSFFKKLIKKGIIVYDYQIGWGKSSPSRGHASSHSSDQASQYGYDFIDLFMPTFVMDNFSIVNFFKKNEKKLNECGIGVIISPRVIMNGKDQHVLTGEEIESGKYSLPYIKEWTSSRNKEIVISYTKPKKRTLQDHEKKFKRFPQYTRELITHKYANVILFSVRPGDNGLFEKISKLFNL